MEAPKNSTFIYFLCQPGFEKALKLEVTRALPEFKFSFSQPGFITFRAPDETAEEWPQLVFAQDAGRVVGKPQRSSWEVLIDSVKDHTTLILLCPKPGEDDLYLEKLRAIRERLQKHLPKTTVLAAGDRISQPYRTPPYALILHDIDAQLTEDFGWNLGRPLLAFTQRMPTKRFPLGAIWPLELEKYPARSYLKTQEAFERYDLPIKAGQIALEVGSAPGGSVQWLLEQDLKVMGVDSGMMTPEILKNKNYRHLSASIFDLKHYDLFENLSRLDWLLIDIHAPPLVTLKALQRCKDHLDAHDLFPKLKGALITIKLNRPDAYQDILEYRRIIFKILEKPQKLWIRQLSSNRKEISVVALRPDPDAPESEIPAEAPRPLAPKKKKT